MGKADELLIGKEVDVHGVEDVLVVSVCEGREVSKDGGGGE